MSKSQVGDSPLSLRARQAEATRDFLDQPTEVVPAQVGLEAARLIKEPRDKCRPFVERQQDLVRNAVDRSDCPRSAYAAGTLDDQVLRKVRALENRAVKIVDLNICNICGHRRCRRTETR